MNSLKKACKGTFNILKSTNLKAMLLKLGIALCLLFITYFVPAFKWVLLVYFMVCVALEYSASSLIWVVFGAVTLPYSNLVGKVAIYLILMGEMLAVYAVKLAIMLLKKQVNIKNWRTITLLSLYCIFSLLMLLPVSQVYKIGSQLSFWYFVTFLLSTLCLIKEINIKNFLKCFVIMVLGICVSFLFVTIVNSNYGVQILASYSKGVVNRFSPVLGDPNLACGVIIIALFSLFALYKQKEINKLVYFSLLTMLGIFVLRTLSKSALIVVAVFAVYLVLDIVITSIITKNKKHLLELVWYLIAFAIVGLIEWQYIDALFYRVTGEYKGWWNQEQTAKPLDNLTTGRMTLWIEYLKAIFGNAQILLFGSGINSGFVFRGAAHNAIIEYLYKLGLVQTLILFAIFVISAIPYLKKLKVHNFVPIALITLFYCSVGSTSAKHMSIFIVSFITLCYSGLINNSVENVDNASFDISKNITK